MGGNGGNKEGEVHLIILYAREKREGEGGGSRWNRDLGGKGTEDGVNGGDGGLMGIFFGGDGGEGVAMGIAGRDFCTGRGKGFI